jgi:hypothetical protein
VELARVIWPADVTAYKLLTDWGSLIGGVLALVAGLFAYVGARQAAAKQVAAVAARDRLQAHGIAVAIYPELLKLPQVIEGKQKYLDQVVAQLSGKQPGQFVAGHLQIPAAIALPPMLNRNCDLLFVLGEAAGPECLQLVSLILQYQERLETTAAGMMMLNAVDWVEGIRGLQELLGVLTGVVARCEQEVRPIYEGVSG